MINLCIYFRYFYTHTSFYNFIFIFLSQNTDVDKKEKEKGSASPFDSTKDDTGPQGNGLASQNGLDEDKGFK